MTIRNRLLLAATVVLLTGCAATVPIPVAGTDAGIDAHAPVTATPTPMAAVAPARTLEIRTDEELFPPVDQVRRIATVRIPHFFMVFPPAVIA